MLQRPVTETKMQRKMKNVATFSYGNQNVTTAENVALFIYGNQIATTDEKCCTVQLRKTKYNNK